MTKVLPTHVKGVVVAAHMRPTRRGSGWNLDNLTGRLVELSGGADTAALTFIAGVLRETQQRGESVAWISAVDSLFYPPDFAAVGIDLAALPVIRVQKGLQAARAADALLRSGGFGMIAVDLGNQKTMSLSVQTRLSGLARHHDVALVVLTRRVRGRGSRAAGTTGAETGAAGPTGSLGALVSLWGESRRERTARDRFVCELAVRKDKGSRPADRDTYGDAARDGDRVAGGHEWRHLEVCRGPDGLC